MATGHDGCPSLTWHWKFDLTTTAGLDGNTADTVIGYMVIDPEDDPLGQVNKVVIIWKIIEPYVCHIVASVLAL
jgi:hypothetical protein